MIEELQKLIYPIPKNPIDKANIEKYLFKIMRTSILEKKYEIEIGPYILNFNPDNLKVFYETEFSKVEMSLQDIYYETSRPIETKYYCLTNEDKDTYSLDIPYYIVEGNIVNINGITEEHFSLELITNNPNLNITDSLNIPENFNIITNKDNELTIAHSIEPNSKRTNPLSLFTTGTKSVYYDEQQDLFIKKDTYIDETYQKYLPNLSKEKEIVAFIYNTMKDFYNKYKQQ